jgi:hypothetical protein
MGKEKLQGGATTEGGEKLQGGFPSGQTSGFPSVGKWRWFPDLKRLPFRSQELC